MKDLRDDIFRTLEGRTADSFIRVNADGVISGTDKATAEAGRLGLTVKRIVPEGARVRTGDIIAHFHGGVKDVVIGEDFLVGLISKPSGIATAAYNFTKATKGGPKIVSGAWKKMPFELKEALRKAVITGGAFIRMCDDPFIYLDKNYIEVFGGIGESLKAVAHLEGFLKVVQLRGNGRDIGLEALEAVRLGADILFVDTGDINDLARVNNKVKKAGMRDMIQIAFGGSVKLEHMEKIITLNVDILDIGAAILDAPLLDLKYDVKRSG
jgi:nicotinate-nucleotide pyrophosphorylase (carboxylating)